MISVYLADDHLAFLEATERLIDQDSDFRCVGRTSNGKIALKEIIALNPNVSILDIGMRSLDGLQILAGLKKAGCQNKVLLVTEGEASNAVYAALAAGGRGYMLKTVSAEILLDVIKLIAKGDTYVPPEMMGMLAAQIEYHTDRGRDPQKLSPREVEILSRIAFGESTEEIANQMQIEASTVRTYLRRSYKKLGVTNQAAAVAKAMRQGLIH